MSRGKRPAVPGFDAHAPVHPLERRTRERRTSRGPAASTATDDEPPSGVLLRCDVLAGVPRLAVSASDLKGMPLDHRAGFIVSFIDGTFTIEMILDACAMRREDALAILRELAARGIIAID